MFTESILFSERCFLGSSHVSTFPPLLRFLRFFRRNSYIPKMDYIPILHQIWFRRYSSRYLWIRQTKVGLHGKALSFQKASDHSGRAGHGQVQLLGRYRRFSSYILHFEDSSLFVLEMETKI